MRPIKEIERSFFRGLEAYGVHIEKPEIDFLIDIFDIKKINRVYYDFLKRPPRQEFLTACEELAEVIAEISLDDGRNYVTKGDIRSAIQKGLKRSKRCGRWPCKPRDYLKNYE